MSVFPFFVNLEGKEGVITGGGKAALEKINKLLPFQAILTVYAEDFMPEIKRISSIKTIHRNIRESDLEKLPDFVIAAGEDMEENRNIVKWCHKYRIAVNVVDQKEYCDFIFPSLIQKGNLSIGICTNGASPSTGMLLKQKIEHMLPERIEEILEFLENKRPEIARAFEHKKERFQFSYELSETCLALGRPLSEAEFHQRMLSYNQKAENGYNS